MKLLGPYPGVSRGTLPASCRIRRFPNSSSIGSALETCFPSLSLVPMMPVKRLLTPEDKGPTVSALATEPLSGLCLPSSQRFVFRGPQDHGVEALLVVFVHPPLPAFFLARDSLEGTSTFARAKQHTIAQLFFALALDTYTFTIPFQNFNVKLRPNCLGEVKHQSKRKVNNNWSGTRVLVLQLNQALMTPTRNTSKEFDQPESAFLFASDFRSSDSLTNTHSTSPLRELEC